MSKFKDHNDEDEEEEVKKLYLSQISINLDDLDELECNFKE